MHVAIAFEQVVVSHGSSHRILFSRVVFLIPAVRYTVSGQDTLDMQDGKVLSTNLHIWNSV